MRAPAILLTLFVILASACDGEVGEPASCLDCGMEIRPQNLTCRAAAPPAELAEAAVAFPRLPAAVEPTVLARPPSGRAMYLAERRGIIYRFDDRADAATLTPVLDLSDEVETRGDGGLVAMAFHPRFEQSGLLFLSYTARGGTISRSRVSRFVSRDGGQSFDRDSRKVLLDFDQSDDDAVHLNGDLQFGPDGFLYAGFGDGGPQLDPRGNAQNRNSFLGKILRLDVDGGDPYRIPASNPFINGPGRPEIYALGLRNPWRFSFDTPTGALWLGDVGYNLVEEINRVTSGGNFGWPMWEGTSCLDPAGCESAGYVTPESEYHHGQQGASVTGGHVYRGKALPQLTGRYIYGDYARGEVWALYPGGLVERVATTGLRIVSFAREASGELLIVDFASGRLFRLQAQAPSTSTLAETLSATGCFQEADPRQPASGLVPYDLRVPFWSDGAVKRRFFALPEGQRATIREDGTLDWPVGSVLVKEFFLGDERIETRLMMKYRDGQWTGASYVWDDDGREAHLVPDAGGVLRSINGHEWSYPGRPVCLDCHGGDRGLGLEVAQLDMVRVFRETGRSANQLHSMVKAGLIAGPVPPPARMPHGKSGTLEEQARAYLHVNCAVCHTRNGPTPVDMDLRFATRFDQMGICDVDPEEGNLHIEDARRLAPGAPERSLISKRMHVEGVGRMPPVGSQLIDQDGVALVDAWIRSLRSCR